MDTIPERTSTGRVVLGDGRGGIRDQQTYDHGFDHLRGRRMISVVGFAGFLSVQRNKTSHTPSSANCEMDLGYGRKRKWNFTCAKDHACRGLTALVDWTSSKPA